MEVVITKSTKSNKNKYDARTDGTKNISFGDSNYSDFTRHKNTDRKGAYKKRYSKEGWGKSNIAPPAWMSSYILCEKPILKSAAGNADKKCKDVKFHLETILNSKYKHLNKLPIGITRK